MEIAIQTEFVYLIIAALAGGLFAAVLGWAGSDEPFDAKKFFSSVLRSILAALGAVFIFQDVSPITGWTYLTAFLLGAGVDVIGHRIAGIVRE